MNSRVRKKSTRSLRLFNLSMYKEVDDNDIKNMTKKFRSTMKDSPRKQEFEEFMKKEFSSENSDFLREVNMLKTLKSTIDMKEWFTHKIYNTYIDVDSDRQINIFSEVREDIEKEIQSGSKDDRIFDQAVKDIEHLIMNDTFTRFLSYKKEK